MSYIITKYPEDPRILRVALYIKYGDQDACTMTTTDAQLLDRWRNRRDAEAFTLLVERYGNMVHGAARRILQDPVEADDIAQECFLKLDSIRQIRVLLPGSCIPSQPDWPSIG